MFYISKRLGHTNIDTTQDYYLSNTKELEKQALEKLDISTQSYLNPTQSLYKFFCVEIF